MEFVTLEARSHHGKNRIAEARRRLPKWDGVTWRVVQERQRVVFSERPGPWVHVAPHTEENTDWCSRWVSLRGDENFTVTANDKGNRPERSEASALTQMLGVER